MTNLYTHTLIPGGAHTYSKGDDQFPANAPRHIDRGDGARVWDAMAANIWTGAWGCARSPRATAPAGHRGGDRASLAGTNFGRPSYVETELAEDIAD